MKRACGRGQWASEYLDQRVRCPRPYASLPLLSSEPRAKRASHEEKGDVRYCRLMTGWHIESNDGASIPLFPNVVNDEMMICYAFTRPFFSLSPIS